MSEARSGTTIAVQIQIDLAKDSIHISRREKMNDEPLPWNEAGFDIGGEG
jgi:hypothetical protein